MRLRLFRAPNMAEAMARVRAELGDDALILGTRPVQEGVEITAALDSSTTAPAASLSPAAQDPRRADLLAFHAVPTPLRARLGDGPLDQALGRTLPFGQLALTGESRPLLLVGTPGAGKTLTVARLATRLVLGGAMPMVITADAKRAGATEQLAAFTRLLGLTLTVASHPLTVGRALARRPAGAPVLIDCPGTDAFDRAQMEELRALAAAADGTVALVLPAGLQAEEAADLAQAHAENGAELLVGTRLDLARRLGGLLAAAAAAPLALVEAGVGPGAADGLVPLTPRELARRMEDRLAPQGAATARPADPRRAAPLARADMPVPGSAPAHDAQWTGALRSPTSHAPARDERRSSAGWHAASEDDRPPPPGWHAAPRDDRPSPPWRHTAPRHEHAASPLPSAAPLDDDGRRHARSVPSLDGTMPRPTPMPAPRARQDARHAE